MNIQKFSIVRWRWYFVGSAVIVAIVGIGLLLYQTGHESDPHRSIRDAYAQKQSNASDPLNPVTTKVTSKGESSPNTNNELRRVEVLPGKLEEDQTVATPPPVELITNEKERKIVEFDPTPAPVFEEPAIPHALLDQTPPSRNKSELKKTEIAPMRYRFNNRSPDAVLGNVVVTEETSAKDFNLDTFAPEMEDIDLALMDNINSSSLELDVAAGVWTPFYFQGKKLLEVGDKLRGQASPGRQRDRLVVKFIKVIKKDGRSLPIQGISLAQDGTLGVPGEKVGNIFQAAAGPLLAELIKGVSESFQDRERGAVNGASVTSDLPVKNLKNAGIRGSQRVLDKIEELMTEEIEENKPYLFIRAGTRLRCRLQVAVDVSQVDYGK